MRDVRLLALDVDGTLVVRGHEVLPRTREALHRAARSGIEVVIATGRRYRTTRHVIDAIGLELPCVCLGGALVKHGDGTTLIEHPYSRERVRAVVEILRAEEQAAIVQRDSAQGGSDFLIDGAPVWNGWTSLYLEENQSFPEWRRDLAADDLDDALVIGAYARREELERSAAAIHARFPGEMTSFITPIPPHVGAPGGHYLEVASASVCKWQGLRALATHLDVDVAQVCAVGDQVNDLTMIRGAGVGVAMGNAHPEVLAAADRTTGRNDEDGIADLVDSLLGIAG